MTTNLTFVLYVAVAFIPIKAHHDESQAPFREKAIGEFMCLNGERSIEGRQREGVVGGEGGEASVESSEVNMDH